MILQIVNLQLSPGRGLLQQFDALARELPVRDIPAPGAGTAGKVCGAGDREWAALGQCYCRESQSSDLT